MKLYALMAHVMEGTELLGVYKDREAALSQKAICETKEWDATLVVLEMNLDEYYESGIARHHDKS